MITNYVNIDGVIEQLSREYISGTHWNLDELKEWTYEALNKIDRKLSNVLVTTNVEIKDGKAKIPAEVELLHLIKRVDDPHDYEVLALRPNQDLDNYTYVLDQGFIHVKFEKGLLQIAYYTTPIDVNGNPMIPDTVYYKAAVLAYLQYKIGRRAYFAGKILQNQLTMLEQEWYFYNNSAKNEQRMDNIRNSRRFRKIHNKYNL